jgi:hypothetical protein
VNRESLDQKKKKNINNEPHIKSRPTLQGNVMNVRLLDNEKHSASNDNAREIKSYCFGQYRQCFLEKCMSGKMHIHDKKYGNYTQCLEQYHSPTGLCLI